MLASLSQALASATEAPGQGLSHLARARLVAETMPAQNGSTENAEFEGAEWVGNAAGQGAAMSVGLQSDVRVRQCMFRCALAWPSFR